MTAYSDIRGYRVKYLASDPTLNTSTEGQVWYNSTEGVLKSLVQIKAWSAGGNLTTSRYIAAGAGTQTAGLGFGGYPPNLSATEEYNGFSWTAGGNLGTARRQLAGCGVQTAALAFGGYTTADTSATEEYDGSAWTAGGNLGTARRALAGAGIQTAGLAFNGPSTEEYDGSAWTAGGNMVTSRTRLAGCGTQTAALGFGGYTSSPAQSRNETEEYDGSSWTAGENLPTGTNNMAGAGTQTAGLGFGGNGGPVTGQTYEYDGNTWTVSSPMATARQELGGAGSRTAGLGFGGYTTAAVANTEEYDSSINVALAGAWSSGGTKNTSRGSVGSGGTQTAGIVFGGRIGLVPTTATEEYDGSTWTTGGAMNSGRWMFQNGAGTQTAAVGMSGYAYPPAPPPAAFTGTEEYDGSTWTSATSIPFGRANAQAGGTQTAAWIAGGIARPPTTIYNSTDEYNGSTYSSGGTMSNYRYAGGGNGPQTAGFAIGGYGGGTGTVPAPQIAAAENYDGSTWTSGTAYPAGPVAAVGSFGPSALAIVFGGEIGPGSNVSTAYQYDGSWTSVASMTSLAGQNMGGAGNATAGFATGGPSGAGTTTEDWNSPSGSVTTASTLTTS